MFVISLMTESIDVGRVDRKLLHDVLVGSELFGKLPVADLVNGEAGDFYRALLSQYR